MSYPYESKVPTQPLIDFEAAWVELYQMLIESHKFLELFNPLKEKISPNPFIIAMEKLQTKYTKEVPIQ